MISLLVAGALSMISAPVQTGVFTADLSKCLVAKTSAEDQVVLMRWVFAAVSAHPGVRDMVKVTEAERTQHAANALALFERLLLVDCRALTVTALKYEGGKAIEASFEVLGSTAMRGLMSDQAVIAELAKLDATSSQAKFKALFKEAGLTP